MRKNQPADFPNRIQRADPLGIRSTTSKAVKNLTLVDFDQDKIVQLAAELKSRIDKKLLLTDSQFGSGEITPQHIFVLDVVNHCFWAKKGEKKWQVEYPKEVITDGWEALIS